MSGPAPLPSGTVLAGKLRVVRLLGSGALGRVYEVVDEVTRHRRALKLLHPRWAADEEVAERFLREALAAGGLGNAHIVRAFEAGRIDSGEPYLVMELLEGMPLSERIAETRGLGMEELLEVLGQTCAAMQAAHDAGIVHGDLTAADVFITSGNGRPLAKVCNFGARRPEPGGDEAGSGEGATPVYTSPEQLLGDADIDARADVYALGVILYECASGKHPYPTATRAEIAARSAGAAAVPLAELRPALPAALSEVVARAMAPEREARFASARALWEDLAALVSDGPIDPLGQTLPASDPPRLSPIAPSSPPSARISGAAPAAPPRASSPPPRASSPPASARPDAAPDRAPRRALFVVGGVAAGVAVAIALGLAIDAYRPSSPAPPIRSGAGDAAPADAGSD